MDRHIRSRVVYASLLSRLRELRLFFQHAPEDRFRETIEDITGRKVRAFISGTDIASDTSSEVFYLEPEGAA